MLLHGDAMQWSCWIMANTGDIVRKYYGYIFLVYTDNTSCSIKCMLPFYWHAYLTFWQIHVFPWYERVLTTDMLSEHFSTIKVKLWTQYAVSAWPDCVDRNRYVEDYNFRKAYLVPELNSKILHGSYSRHRCMREEIVMVQGSDVLKEWSTYTCWCNEVQREKWLRKKAGKATYMLFNIK